MPNSKLIKTVDRGLEGWFQALEIIDPPDTLRIGGTFHYVRDNYTARVVTIAKRIKPTREGGIVVLVVPA